MVCYLVLSGVCLQPPNESLSKALQTSLFYVKFKSLASKVRFLIQEIEARCEGHLEYLGLLGECLSAYFSARLAILGPTVSTSVAALSQDTDILTSVCIDVKF
jgi:hypothetical protein